MPHYFSLEEASSLLDELRPAIEEIMQIHQRVIELRPDAWQAIEKSAGNGGSLAASRLLPEFDRLRSLVHQVQDHGVILKDMGLGLLDFPSLREGREVYLCWKYGEDRIAFWHEVEAGFMGRQPL
ncbi:MAG TPA: DUF2203 domain-containing protein [Anaerolineales bacterium]